MHKLKKSLGQHLLNNEEISQKIANSILNVDENKTILEVGPGTGNLTKYLFKFNLNLILCEKDKNMVNILNIKFKDKKFNLLEQDFLEMDLNIFENNFYLIGNFPYNISTQIIFKMLENKEKISQMVGMFQHEVALRICAKHGNKDYGILSIITQAYYNCEYLFKVGKENFIPPPKVESGVIRLNVIENPLLSGKENYTKLLKFIKICFNQRRKKLKHILNKLTFKTMPPVSFFEKRAEQISVKEYIDLVNNNI